ncbi:MAG TPA: response regulator [Terriglobia bacterium]|nr:response regulator [Terriglobia bacterium]
MTKAKLDETRHSPKKLRILYAEDNSADAELILLQLKKNGFDFHTEVVDTPDSFQDKLRSHHYDLILSDYSMPNWSAMGALEIAQREAQDIPFILISGSIGDEAIVECMKQGVTDYVLKDRPARLPAAVRRALNDKSLRDERIQVEKELRFSEVRYRRLFEAAKDGILILDGHTGEILDVNPFLMNLLGYTRQEFLGKQLWEIGFFQDREDSKGTFRTLQASEFIRYDDLTLQTKGGKRAEVEFVSNTYFSGEKKVIQCNIRDMTERRQLELQLRQSQKMEAIGQLAGGVAHDFNNLLTIISGYSEMMAEGLGPDSPHIGQVKEIQKATDRAAALTRQLLAFGRRQMLAPQVLDLNMVVSNVDKMLRRLIGEDIDLVPISSGGLGRVKADAGQIEQIIMNLAVNARDAMPQGGKLTIETADVVLDDTYARRHVAVTPGPYVMLAVSDTGCGMDAAIQARIFEPFFTTKAPGKGTGLGLATVYGIVKQSGGNIWMYSELGKGSTFKVYLPRVDDLVAEVKSFHARGGDCRGTETVLVVEDEDTIRSLVGGILVSRGYTVLEASSGVEGLLICQKHPHTIHLLLTDVVMPQMSGPELAGKLASLRPETKVLFMSGYTNKAIGQDGLLDRNTAFIEKPFTPQALARKVREVLDAPTQPSVDAAA